MIAMKVAILQLTGRVKTSRPYLRPLTLPASSNLNSAGSARTATICTFCRSEPQDLVSGAIRKNTGCAENSSRTFLYGASTRRLEDEADLRCSHEARLELSLGKPKKPIALYGVIPYIRLEAETM
jgi:hypothetical protein